MAQIEHEIIIPAPVSDVFREVANFESVPAWQPSLIETTVMAGKPLRAGSMVTQKRRLIGRVSFLNVDLLEYQRNKLIDMKGVLGNYRLHRVITLDSQGRETRIRDEIDLNGGLLQFLTISFARRSYASQTSQEWENLKKHFQK